MINKKQKLNLLKENSSIIDEEQIQKDGCKTRK